MGKAVLSSGKRLRHGELCVTRSASLHRSASTGNMNRALTHANWEEKAPSRPWAQFAARKRSQRVEEKTDRPKEAVIWFDVSYITPWIRYDDHERTLVFRRGLKVPCCPLQDLWAGNMRRCMCTGKSRREKGWAEENESWDGERNITKDFCVASGHNEMALKLQQVYGVSELCTVLCVWKF